MDHAWGQGMPCKVMQSKIYCLTSPITTRPQTSEGMRLLCYPCCVGLGNPNSKLQSQIFFENKPAPWHWMTCTATIWNTAHLGENSEEKNASKDDPSWPPKCRIECCLGDFWKYTVIQVYYSRKSQSFSTIYIPFLILSGQILTLQSKKLHRNQSMQLWLSAEWKTSSFEYSRLPVHSSCPGAH